MGLDELMSALRQTRTIQEHPDWPRFAAQKLPRLISFYYTNQDGQEAYWDQARIIKIDLPKLHLIVEGKHGDPLKFEIPRIMHCKDAQTGEKAQALFFELARLWRETYTDPTSPDPSS